MTDFDPMEELIAELNEGEKPIGKKGRRAVLSRAQIENIQDDERPVAVIAKELDVSVSTIHRAKHHGYRTAAENGAHSYRLPHQKQMPEEQRVAIAKDPRPAKDVANEYNVTRSYVYMLRTKYNGPPPEKGPLPEEVMNEILTSELDNEAVARRLSISPTIVRLIRRDYGGRT